VKSPADSALIDGPKPQARSRISNGSAVFLEGVDGRSILARRYRDILASLVSDMGGDPSEAQSLIARRSATLAVWCELAETAMAKGDDLNIAEFTTAANALRRLLSDLGLERQAHDVTHQTLAEIAEELEAGRAE
jgi:hypothetical protein